MHRRFLLSGRLRAGVPLALAAGLALTASACMAPSAKQSSAAGERAARTGPAQSGAEGEKTKGTEVSWWQRITQSHREPGEKPWVYGDVRPGKGLLSNDEDGHTLYRQGGAGSSDPNKPTKVRR